LNNYQANTRFVGKKSKYLDICPSTNSLALSEALNEDIEEGFAWIAGHQTAGRGQRGNTWNAEPNQNLTLSYLLRPPHHLLEKQFFLSKAIANGILSGLEAWSRTTQGENFNFEIKWPNDIYLDGVKMGGILIENNIQAGKWSFSIIGIGLNINQSAFENIRGTSLRSYLDLLQPISLTEIYQYLSQGIEEAYIQFSSEAFNRIDEIYHEKLFRRSQWALFEAANEQFEGKILGVNEQGLLEIEKKFTVESYDLKEISFIFPS
jgi:BirA family transcriptional regulator, biotin operon repressor / biotin---[acetyl-CoA-carboxylase] ligase